MPPLFLRMISSLNKWDRENTYLWLAPDDIPADPITDLKTADNKLSVFQVNNGDEIRINKIAAALAAKRLTLQPFAYILFDVGLPSRLDIQVGKTNRGTDIQIVNDWHFELIELSAQKLFSLTRDLLLNADPERKRENEVVPLIMENVRSGELDPDKMDERLRKSIAEFYNQDIETLFGHRD
jgi:hypothetical protein